MAPLKVTIDDAICVLRLTRPEKRNALSLGVIEEIVDAQRVATEKGVLGMLVTAEGPDFCSGHDLSDLEGADTGVISHLFRRCAVMMQAFQKLPFPVVAAVQGAAIGAGAQLALSADLVVAADDTYLQTPGGKGSWFCHTPMLAILPHLTPKRALEMLFLGEPVPAEQALHWGLVNRVVPAPTVEKEALGLLQRAVRGSPISKSMGKQTYYGTRDMSLESAYLFATEVMAATAATEEAQAEFRRFLHRRK
jgi:enoyl-CoA hydratase/carnithine racemase